LVSFGLRINPPYNVDLDMGFIVGGVGFDRLEFGIDRLKWNQSSIKESYTEQLKPSSEAVPFDAYTLQPS
jgi:hypothetical protein